MFGCAECQHRRGRALKITVFGSAIPELRGCNAQIPLKRNHAGRHFLGCFLPGVGDGVGLGVEVVVGVAVGVTDGLGVAVPDGLGVGVDVDVPSL